VLGFFASGVKAMELSGKGIRVTSFRGKHVVSFENIRDITVRKRLLWRCVDLSSSDGDIVLRGVPWRSAQRFRKAVLAVIIRQQQRKLRELWPTVLDIHQQIQELAQGKHYIRWSEVQKVLERGKAFEDLVRSPHKDRLVTKKDRSLWRVVCKFLAEPESVHNRWNEQFIKRELDSSRSFFNQLSLTDEQRTAIVTDEDNTLVVAAAGSGKTRLLIAKIAYLLKIKRAHPHEFLIISFNNDAAREIRQRLHAIGIGTEIKVKTIHSVGREIIGEVEGEKPPLSKLATDQGQIAFMNWIRTTILEEIRDPEAAEALAYFASYIKDSKTVFAFNSEDEYEKYVKSVGRVSLKGDTMKSLEEIEIANFLYLNGVNYEYEAEYPDAPGSPHRKRYQPDFFLPDYHIYIEHFAVDEKGKTPPFINQKKYTRDMEWKRQLHQERRTVLIETYSYQKRDGTLLRDLRNKLESHSVKFCPMSTQEALKRLRERGQIDRLSRLIATFLKHVKSNGYTMEWLHSQAKQRIDRYRVYCFLQIFERVSKRYDEHLKKEGGGKGRIDFYDMVNKATEYVSEGRYQSPYRYVLVDEFQDISVSLGRLIRALLDQRRPEARLFCVGDDWQAIYRFAGADLALMLSMKDYFGYTKQLLLTKTFRLNSAIAQVSSKFIQENPAQIHKQVLPAGEVKETSIKEASIFVIPADYSGVHPLKTAFGLIAKKAKQENCTVLLLSRYSQDKVVKAFSYLKPELNWLKTQGKKTYPNIEIVCDRRENHKGNLVRTVHSVKGLEADFVIVVGMARGEYGFPCEIMDDPILDIVLAKSDSFPYDEERRLFYVALTRAKKAVFLVTNRKNQSNFVTELEQEDHLVERIGERCPKCGEGVLVVRKGPHGEFLGCSEYPKCKYTKAISKQAMTQETNLLF